MRVVDVRVVGRQVFDKDIRPALLYHSPQTTADLSLTARKQILRVMHAAEHEIIHLPRPWHLEEQNPSGACDDDALFC